MQLREITTLTGADIVQPRAIAIEVRSVYGELKAYPACHRARIFADIAGTKTLTRSTLELVQLLGFRIDASANADWSGVS